MLRKATLLGRIRGRPSHFVPSRAILLGMESAQAAFQGGRFLDSSNGRLYIDRWSQQGQLWLSLRAGFTARDPS